jgi:hypothetical protein
MRIRSDDNRGAMNAHPARAQRFVRASRRCASQFRSRQLVLLIAFAMACGRKAPTDPNSGTQGNQPTAADRVKFIGTWLGSYRCPGQASAFQDRLIIAAGTGTLEFRITIHANTDGPDTISGTLATATRIDVPTQTLGGLSGTATITHNGLALSYQQSGLGITCGGTDYIRVP